MTTSISPRKIMRVKGSRWCEIEIRLENGRLSICGAEGRILSPAKARKEAREYWRSFFEDEPNELGRMAVEFGTRKPATAARKVMEVDGEYHGLDVHAVYPSGICITESCGQIREELAKWFPEAVPYMGWHLNDMHAECIHQESRGETYSTHPGAVCPECGWKLGHGWNKRELPADVIEWARSFGEKEVA